MKENTNAQRLTMSTRKLLVPLLIIIILFNCYYSSFADSPTSNSDDYPLETYVYILVYHGKHQHEEVTFATKNITKAVRIGDYVSLQLVIDNKGKHVISATVNCNFTQGQDIAGTVEYKIWGLGAIIAGNTGSYLVIFDELPKVGVISMNFSYEVYWEEDGEVKNFTSGGTAYEVHLEVKEKGVGVQHNFTQIGAIVAIIAVVVIVLIVKRRIRCGKFHPRAQRVQSSRGL